jgi:ubiquinone/menaquinone biosynthesis C-methylase UbiE
MPDDVHLIGAAYDRLAANYDQLWSVHVREPQARLTRALGLSPGLRCVDLGCGTGIDTLEVCKRVAPGEVLAIDPSATMLAATLQRMAAAGLPVETRCQSADEFIARAAAGGFDVITLRFCLGYLDWHAALARLPRLLRPAGRIGILTILASSAPQAYATYRCMAAELGLDALALNALGSIDAIGDGLCQGGAVLDETWTHSFRLAFRDGAQPARWLRTSGIATNPMLAALPLELANVLWDRFAVLVEAHREGDTIPLDFHLAGVIARRAARDSVR